MRVRAFALVAIASGIGGVVLAGCGGGDKKKKVEDEDAVQLAFENFQPTILKITTAGIAAKGTASQGANIPVIPLVGLVTGTGGIGGTVAQSGGQNENLNLWVELNAYSDTGDVTFQTDNTSDTTKLQFDLQITNQPQDNRMDGTIVGSLTLGGDIEGTGIFDLATASDLEDDDGQPDLICTHVTGTVEADSEVIDVDFVLPLTLDSALAATCATL